jgi:hypothetical protein
VELRGYIKNTRWSDEYLIPRLKIFLWAEEKLIQHLREKKLNNILES